MASEAVKSPTIVAALMDEKLLGATFPDLATWRAWVVFFKGLFALPMTAEELAVFSKHTGRSAVPTQQSREAWVVAGRRAGKSRMAALLGVYAACFRDYSMLAPGERATVMLLAADRQQARVLLRYVNGILAASPLLAAMVVERLKESVQLSNGVDVEVHTSSFVAVRGYSLATCIADEAAFWRSETTANPDVEVINAVRPGLVSIPGSLLLGISSPYSRRGVLWQAYRDHFGNDGDPVLVWQADTRSMNPTIEQRIVEEAFERDATAAAAEWGAEFRRDIESFVSVEVVDAVVIPERHALPPVEKVRYFGFVDPSGGSQDSMTLALAHRDKEATVLDLVLERRPPFSPESVAEEFSATLKEYRVSKVVGDRYGGEWPREQFRKNGVSYETSERTKSDIYRELLPLLNSGKLELLHDRRLIAQLTSLERRTSRTGKDSIDHPPGSHDDVANAAAGALVLAAKVPCSLGAPVGVPKRPLHFRGLAFDHRTRL